MVRVHRAGVPCRRFGVSAVVATANLSNRAALSKEHATATTPWPHLQRSNPFDKKRSLHRIDAQRAPGGRAGQASQHPEDTVFVCLLQLLARRAGGTVPDDAATTDQSYRLTRAHSPPPVVNALRSSRVSWWCHRPRGYLHAIRRWARHAA